jgi:hypothetical protein
MSPSDRVTQLYPQTPDALSVAFYDSQGYSGGILTRLHTGPEIITVQYFRIHIKTKCSQGHHVDVIDGREMKSGNVHGKK